MQLKQSSLHKLSDMICGNTPFDYFPYRSSSYLTNFFMEIDLDYIHDGSTRAAWVHDVLHKLNTNSRESMPSEEMVKVIEHLLNPENFLFEETVDFTEAKKSINQILKLNNLTLKENLDDSVTVVPLNGEFISTEHKSVPTEKLITFKPGAFQIPDKPQQENLVSVMMPFNSAFNNTFDSIKKVTDYMNLECKRADDIWNNSTILQDIFELIFCAKVVIVDFSQRNPNVMYETGIAHALGKQIVPLTQAINDIPSDIGNHRALHYFPNEQGYKDLSNKLYKRLKTIYNIE